MILMIRLFLFLVVLPICLGGYLAGIGTGRRVSQTIEYRESRYLYLLKAYTYGWMVLFALFELVCVPFVVQLGKFSTFSKVFNLVLLAAVVCSVAFSIRRWLGNRHLEIRYADAQETAAGKTVSIVLWILVIVFILGQMVYLYFYNHMNGDDSYFVAESVITDYFDTMFQRDAYTGMPIGLDERHALAALPMLMTWLGRMCGLHPTVICHSVMAPVLLALMYCVYTLVGNTLLKRYRNYRPYIPLFLLFVNIWYLWGNVSIFTAETFMYTRTWQGKAVFGNIIIPLTFCFLYEWMRERKKSLLIMLTIMSVCGVLVTTAAVYLMLILYGIAALWLLLREHKLKPCFQLAVCGIPCLLYGIIYFYLLTLWRYV